MDVDYFGGGCQLRNVRVFSQYVHVSIRPRVAEVERRQALGVRSIGNWDVIRALMTLPEGVPLAAAALGIDALLVLDELVRLGAVDEVDDQVIRLAVPPVELVGLTKVATTWADVQAITLLRTHAPRLVIAPAPLARRVLRDIDPAVGVAVSTSDGIECLRAPTGHQVRPTWRRWVTAETAYEAWLPIGLEPITERGGRP